MPEAIRMIRSGYFLVGFPWQTVKLDLDWGASTQLADVMGIMLQAPYRNGQFCIFGYDLFPVWGQSPVELRMDRSDWEQAEADDDALCEIALTRVYFEVLPTAQGSAAIAYAEQRFTVTATFAYHATLEEQGF